MRRVINDRDLLGDLEVELARKVVVGAFGHVHDLLQRRLFFIVEIDVEMRGVVDVPMELVIDDLVLPERICARCKQNGDEEQQSDRSLQLSLHERVSRPPTHSVNTYLVAEVSWGTKIPTSCVSIDRRF